MHPWHCSKSTLTGLQGFHLHLVEPTLKEILVLRRVTFELPALVLCTTSILITLVTIFPTAGNKDQIQVRVLHILTWFLLRGLPLFVLNTQDID